LTAVLVTNTRHKGTLEVYCRGARAVFDQRAQKLSVFFSGATVLDMQGATGLFAAQLPARRGSRW
jgi:hypothetical protein